MHLHFLLSTMQKYLHLKSGFDERGGFQHLALNIEFKQKKILNSFTQQFMLFYLNKLCS